MLTHTKQTVIIITEVMRVDSDSFVHTSHMEAPMNIKYSSYNQYLLFYLEQSSF